MSIFDEQKSYPEGAVYSCSAWEWNHLVNTYFPKWFHPFIDQTLVDFDIGFGYAGVLLQGRVVINILDDARLLFAESKGHTRLLEMILLDVNDEIETTYGLSLPGTKVIVRR